MNTMQLITTLIPVLSILILLVILRVPAKIAMSTGFFLTAIFSYIFYKMPLNAIIASSIEGFVLSFSILWVMFGVIFTYHILQTEGINKTITKTIENITTHKPAQLIIITIFFTSIIEGIAGFGTSAMLCIPILISLGFTPLTSVIFSVLGNTASINFGATGAPVVIGLSSGLKNGNTLYPQVENYLSNHNITFTEFISQITHFSEGVNLITTTLFPLFITIIYTKFFNKKKSIKYGTGFAKFALITGAIFSTSHFLIQRYLGPEFPSILAGAIATLTSCYFAKKNLFIKEPQKIKRKHKVPTKKILIAFAPYIILTAFLIITRLTPPIQNFLKSHSLSLTNILNTPISVNFEYLYSTGTIFILTGICTIFFLKIQPSLTASILKKSIHHMINPLIVLTFSVSMIRIFLNSYINDLSLPSAPSHLACIISNAFGSYYPLVGGLIGGLGSFLTGSSTFSSMMFASFQFDTALNIGQNPAHTLGLQLTSGSIGNGISLLNIIAACGIAGLKNKEGTVIRINFLPILTYCLLLGLINYIIYICR